MDENIQVIFICMCFGGNLENCCEFGIAEISMHSSVISHGSLSQSSLHCL